MRVAYVAVLMLGVTAAASAQSPVFDRVDSPSFAGARAIVSADFNRDGWTDVAQANTGRNSVTILLNRAGAGLLRSSDVPVGLGPFDICAADFNRDGVPDLAVANADASTISVLLGRGDGSFLRSDVAVPSQNPRGIAVDDVNRDGRVDLIYSGYATGRVAVLLGTGDGRFTSGPSLATGKAQPQGVAAADFNHDGLPDVAVAFASSAGLRVLYGNGGTGFTMRAVPGAVNLNVLAAGDLDRDGWTDVAAASSSGNGVVVYRGGSTGLTFSRTVPVGSSPRGIATGDLTGDGVPDIVTANRTSSTISLLQGVPAGGFLESIEIPVGAGGRAVAIADFGQDSKRDIATGNEFVAATTVLSNGAPDRPAGYAFTRVPLDWVARTSRGTPAPVDLNLDGHLDYAAGGYHDRSIALLIGGASTTLPVNGFFRRLRIGDLNRDGYPDLLYAATQPDTLCTYLSNGRGGFVRGTCRAWTGSLSFELGDLNRDGRLDLVATNVDDPDGVVMTVSLGRADGSIGDPVARLGLPETMELLPLADVNRDGRLDVVGLLRGSVRRVPTEARVWLGSLSGGLIETSWSVPFTLTYGANGALADINRDGFLDLVGSEAQQMLVALGTPDGFAPPSYSQLVTSERVLDVIAIADLDDDGSPDVAFGSGDVLYGNGDGTFEPAGRFDYGAASELFLADITRDGLADIVNFTGGGAVVLANTRRRTNRPPTVSLGPDRTIDYAGTQGQDCDVFIRPDASDPDVHELTYEWRRNGELIFEPPILLLCGPPPGTYVYTLTVRDGRGGEASDSVTVTIPSMPEIVLWAADALREGRWQAINDPAAAGGVRVYDPNRGVPKVPAPVQLPGDVVTFRFVADPDLTYKLWIRLKADGNAWANDSVWVQFDGATDTNGTPKYQVGTTSGLAVNLEECSGCGLSGWGWEDDGWGAPGVNGTLLRFPQNPDNSNLVAIHIQPREDGVSIDQIVLSASKYLTARPGAARNDTTILKSTQRSQ
jgi:hypothetical protein